VLKIFLLQLKSPDWKEERARAKKKRGKKREIEADEEIADKANSNEVDNAERNQVDLSVWKRSSCQSQLKWGFAQLIGREKGKCKATALWFFKKHQIRKMERG